MLPCIAASELTADSSRATVLRGLLNANRVEAALAEIRRGLEATPQDSLLHALFGDALFRKAEFVAAEDAYAEALRIDNRNARASWGLGRIALLQSRPAEAARRFARAFQMDPRDPDLILSYADCVQDPAARAVLLRNFLKLSDPNDIVRREHTAAQLEIAEQLGQRRTRVVSPAAAYHFELTDLMFSAGRSQGLLLTARMNGGKPVRLLLDSGAGGIYLSSRAAGALDLETLSEARIAGLGPKGAMDGQVALARSLTVDGLQIENSILHVVDLAWLEDADGVIGTDVFKDFLVRLDPRKRTLDLLPFPASPPRDTAALPAYRIGHYLLVHGSANKRSQGYFMVDTGASATVIDARAATSVLPSTFEETVDLRDARGSQLRDAVTAPASVTLAGREWWDTQATALDLADLSKQTGVEILGVLGYPVLRQSPLIINYRDGLVEFAGKR